jgi:hypothetical protein
MAVLDPSRTAVELSHEELRDATALLAGGDHGAASRDALVAAGVLRDGAIVPYVGRLLMVVAEPKLRIVVERFVAEHVIVEQVWATELIAVWGAEGRSGGMELRPVEPSLLPWEIMNAVGLGPRGRASVETTLRIAATTFEQATQLLAADDREAAEALLAAATRLDAAERGALLDLLLDRRSSWRASSVWTEASGPRTEWVSVVDGGDSGLWLSTHEDDDGEDPVICLRPVPPSTVWHRLVALVPAPPDAPAVPDE